MDLFALALKMAAEGDDKIVAQLSALQRSLDATSQHVTDLDSKFEKSNRGAGALGDTLKTLAGLLATVGVGAFFAGASREVDEAQAALLQLDATAQATSRSQSELRKESAANSEQFVLSTGTAAKYTATIARLVDTARSTKSSHDVLNAVLDITAARGLKAADGMAALEGALRGSDRAASVLLQRDLSGDFDRFARSIGTTADKLDAAQRAQVLLNAIVTEGETVRGKYSEWLNTAAGRTQKLAEETSNAKQRVGELLNPIRELGTAAATAVVKGFDPLVLTLGASAIGIVGVAPAAAAAIYNINEAALALNLTMGGLIAKMGGWAVIGTLAATIIAKWHEAKVVVAETLSTDLKKLYNELGEQEEARKQLVDDAAGSNRYLSMNYQPLDTGRLDKIASTNSAEFRALRDKEQEYVRFNVIIRQLRLDIDEAAAAEAKLRATANPPTPKPPPGGAQLTPAEQDALDQKRIENMVKIAELQGLTLNGAVLYIEEANKLAGLAKAENVTLEQRVKLLERAAALRGAATATARDFGYNTQTGLPDVPFGTPKPTPPLPPVSARETAAQRKALGLDKPLFDADKLNTDLEASVRAMLVVMNKNPFFRMLRELPGLREDLAEGITNAISDGLASGIAEGISKGNIGAGFAAMTRALLGGLGAAMVQFGKKALLFSTLMAKIKAGLTSLLPGGAIVASLAMIAIGAALQGAAAGLFSGGDPGTGGASGFSSHALGGEGGDARSTRIIFGANSASTAAGMTPRDAVHVTIIGPNDPQAQRQILELIDRGYRRGGTP